MGAGPERRLAVSCLVAPGGDGSVTTETVYLKAEQHTEVTDPRVTVGDVVKVYSRDRNLQKKVSELLLLQSSEKKDTDYMLSILKVVELITGEFPQVTIQNEGETDFIVTVRKSPRKPAWRNYGKVVLVSLICFFGAAFSIMTFNEDASVKDVFGYISEMVLGEGSNAGQNGTDILELSYCIGLPLGIIIFYNHFAGLRVQRDPTPIQTQMRLYEQDVNQTLIQNASREGKTIDAD